MLASSRARSSGVPKVQLSGEKKPLVGLTPPWPKSASKTIFFTSPTYELGATQMWISMSRFEWGKTRTTPTRSSKTS